MRLYSGPGRNLVKRWQPTFEGSGTCIYKSCMQFMYYGSCTIYIYPARAMLNGAVVRICMVFDILDKCVHHYMYQIYKY